MPLDDADYREILTFTRETMREYGLGLLDERALASQPTSQGAFFDLVFYIKHLTGQISLGSLANYEETLHRLQENVRGIEGIRINMGQNADRYGVAELEVQPNQELDPIVRDLHELLRQLFSDRDNLN